MGRFKIGKECVVKYVALLFGVFGLALIMTCIPVSTVFLGAQIVKGASLLPTFVFSGIILFGMGVFGVVFSAIGVGIMDKLEEY